MEVLMLGSVTFQNVRIGVTPKSAEASMMRRSKRSSLA